MSSVEYFLNRASSGQVEKHLLTCDADFLPRLSDRVDILTYSEKIVSKAVTFEAWADDTLIGLVAMYCDNEESRVAYITNVSVFKIWSGKGIAAHLMALCLERARLLNMDRIALDVGSDNIFAIKLYEKNGFTIVNENAKFISMNLDLKSGEKQ